MYCELFKEIRLIVYDFDGTLAQTDQESPNGLTVAKAYAYALDEIFGKHGLLEAVGGLQNRAPAELVLEVLRKEPSLIGSAKEFYVCHRERLSGLVPRGKGVDLDFALRRGDELGFCAELVVRAKLAHLNRERGVHQCGVWPPPCKGVDAHLRARGDQLWGVISSGHEAFIAGTFQLWRVSYPPFSVTDDDVRGLSLPPEVTSKPSPYLFDILRRQVASYGYLIPRDHILYIGDDPVKDGGLARNAGVHFLWYNEKGRPSKEGIQEFRHWNELTQYIG